ncbi:MAG: prepilin-type N-terminal cleavage/methylation domain-containing protein [Verrucomicrobiales bacterium]|jgi:prepilin-type N-terminal cleavage/methylation domain-containing protein
MKPFQTQKRRKGFTLVELLVVIVIIGILTSILLPVGSQVMKSMRKTTAGKTATELRTALTNYYTEYKKFPPVNQGSGQDTEIFTDGSTGLIAALMAVSGHPATEKLNRRGEQYFSSKMAKKKKGSPGVHKKGNTFSLLDPWGMPYIIAFDSNYDDQLEVPERESGNGTEIIFTNVAVWSYGPNMEKGKGRENKNDDIGTY